MEPLFSPTESHRATGFICIVFKTEWHHSLKKSISMSLRVTNAYTRRKEDQEGVSIGSGPRNSTTGGGAFTNASHSEPAYGLAGLH